MTNKQLKLAFLNDFSSKEFNGGTTITCNILIEEGKRQGREIDFFTYKDLPDICSLNKLDNFDLIVLNNISYFQLDVIKELIRTKNYITINHDYGWCSRRNGKCGIDHEDCMPAKIFIDIFAKSKLNIFFSPLQLNIHKEKFGQVLRDAVCIPAPIERGKFYPDKNLQRNAYLYAGAIATHKGVHQILDFADTQEDKVFHFAGKPVNQLLVKIIKDKHTYLGEIPHEQMPQLYRKYKYFLYNSQMHETFCHSIIEAMLSGCTVVRFEKSWETGMESYNLPPTEMIERCYNAPVEFWQKIEIYGKNTKT